MPKNRGKDLEQLVALLERALAAGAGTIIESPSRLTDRRTGRLREHDVVLTSHVGHHQLRIALECRDRSRPVGVPEVEAFYQKCIDTEIGGGAIVSSTGFYQSAREKADSLGVRCLDLGRVTEVDWLAAGGLPVFNSRLVHAEIVLHVAEDGITGVKPSQLYDADSRPVSDLGILTFLHNCLSLHLVALLRPPRTLVPIRLALDGLYARADSVPKLLRVIGITGTLHYVTEATTAPFQLLRYQEHLLGRTMAEAAVSEVQAGLVSGRLALVLDDDRNVIVSFEPATPI